jgi:hypothetical protein
MGPNGYRYLPKNVHIGVVFGLLEHLQQYEVKINLKWLEIEDMATCFRILLQQG